MGDENVQHRWLPSTFMFMVAQPVFNDMRNPELVSNQDEQNKKGEGALLVECR